MHAVVNKATIRQQQTCAAFNFVLGIRLTESLEGFPNLVKQELSPLLHYFPQIDDD